MQPDFWCATMQPAGHMHDGVHPPRLTMSKAAAARRTSQLHRRTTNSNLAPPAHGHRCALVHEVPWQVKPGWRRLGSRGPGLVSGPVARLSR